MLVVHMDSGLGNQMLDYAEFLAIKQSNPEEKCYLENYIYDIAGQKDMTSQWNGYELKKIFGLDVPNISDLLGTEKSDRVRNKFKESEFWNKGWNYAPVIVEALQDEGIVLNNYGKKAEVNMAKSTTIKGKLRYGLTRFFTTGFGYHIKRILRKLFEKSVIKKYYDTHYDIYRKYPTDSYVGHSLNFKYKGFDISKVDTQLREHFKFPEFSENDTQNKQILEFIRNEESVAIHARRDDLLSVNGHCYEHGFFKRSVKYIKKHVSNPVFIFFTDEKSIGWCEENARIFGLDFSKDNVSFVTWNKGQDSYKDMYLMSQCKHNIFTESSFGFWGAYLNNNPNKITCAPDVKIIATNCF